MGVSHAEQLIFQHWIIVLRLLKMGIPYDTVESLSEMDVAIVLGVDSALRDREQAAQARSMR